MAKVQVHTAYGWVDLDDLIPGKENCDKCGEKYDADSAGYQNCNPPELIIWFCRECRKTHG